MHHTVPSWCEIWYPYSYDVPLSIYIDIGAKERTSSKNKMVSISLNFRMYRPGAEYRHGIGHGVYNMGYIFLCNTLLQTDQTQN